MFRLLKTCALFLLCLAAVLRPRRETAEISANTSSSVLRSLYFLIKGMMLVSIKKCRLLARQFLNAYQERDCMHPLADPGSLYASLYWSSYYSLGVFFFLVFYFVSQCYFKRDELSARAIGSECDDFVTRRDAFGFFPSCRPAILNINSPPSGDVQENSKHASSVGGRCVNRRPLPPAWSRCINP